MRRIYAPLLLLLLAACATAPRYDGRRLQPVANPGQVVAADRAFARAWAGDDRVKELGDLAWKDAFVVLPNGPVSAEVWLRSSAVASSANRQTARVFSSCDGSLAVVRGIYTATAGKAGKYVTVWQRQRGGNYEWKLDMAWADAEARESSDMIGTKIADCSEVLESVAWGIEGDDGETWREGISADESLGWRFHYSRSEGRELLIDMWAEGSMSEVVAIKLAPAR